MRLARPQKRPQSEGTITLINVVFLMLIFFLIAGTLTPPLDNDIALISAETGEPVQPPDTLSARANGELYFRGEFISAEAFLAELRKSNTDTTLMVRVIADKELPALKLIDLVSKLRGLGVNSVHVITERANP